MKNVFKRLRLTLLFYYLVVILIYGTFSVFYFANFFNFRDLVDITWVYFGSAALLAISIILTFATIFVFVGNKRQAELKAADLIGDDIQEAYHFGQIGLIVVDENKNVLWTNELFRERNIDLLDKNLLEWQPELEKISSGKDATMKIEFNSHNYDVKFLSDASLYIFKDVTDYETIFANFNKEAMVVGILTIDNYNDINEQADDTSDVVSKVRNAIFEYTKKYNVLLSRNKANSYFILCNYESLERMIGDKFSLLDIIHKIGEKEDIPPTISLGIAHNFPDVLKLNEMAVNALEIATSRGGDQVVVSKYGEELQFFGGKTEAVETRNKVKVRVMSDSVLQLIKSSTNVLIMGHDMADMDAMGACLGMKAMCDYAKKPTQIIYNPHRTESKTRGALTASFSRDELSKITIHPNEAVDKVKPNTLVIVCDVHKPSMTMAPAVLEKASRIMVIDHHRRGEDYIENPVFNYIEPSASSACEMVAELIRFSSSNPRITIPNAYATVMLSGIFMDTQYFKAKTTGIRTFEACTVLKDFGADNSKADDFLKDEFEEYMLVTRITSTLFTPEVGVVVCLSDENDVVEDATLGKVANQCMRMRGVHASFVIGKITEKDVKISCRSDGTINVQLLAEKMHGGGHFTMAAGMYKDSTIAKAKQRLLDILSEYLDDARSSSDSGQEVAWK